jgi:16S rRNA (cytosine967-C5)-methyltransferase
MTPAARIAAAIEVLDVVAEGRPVEQALTNWARRSRYAGSGDRAAIRDHVFDALRCRRSFAALGGESGGRGLMIGALRAVGQDPASVFTGEGFAPHPMSAEEQSAGRGWEELSRLERLDCPDWIAPALEASLGGDFADVMSLLRVRAPVFLRVNLLKADIDTARDALARESVKTEPHPLAETALLVTEGAKRIRATHAFRDGLIELQDAASQAVVEAIGATQGQGAVLDYCAGGGGKALALAARGWRTVVAHDAAPRRMRDLPERAARAGADIRLASTADLAGIGLFDLVVCDVPCSGSGAWRRQPEAKWTLTPGGLARLCALQSGILDAASRLVATGGRLAYITCSLLAAENAEQIEAFLYRTAGWRLIDQRSWTPLDGGDGFGISLLTR